MKNNRTKGNMRKILKITEENGKYEEHKKEIADVKSRRRYRRIGEKGKNGR